jgi:hypothetical protein
MQQSQGDKIFQSFMENTGGLNFSDSVFTVKDNQATGGFNYEYVRTGGIQKSLCPTKINSAANAQLKTLGIALRNTKTSGKSIIRAAGTKIQLTDLSGTFTDLTEDTLAVNSDFLSGSSDQPVVKSMFVTPSTDVLWLAGGGMSSIYGVASATKVTENGSAAPTGIITATQTTGGGSFTSSGTYYYAVAFHKASTGALSNVSLDVELILSSATDSVTIDVSGLTNLDATKYDEIYIYRSAVGGVSGFTTGDLIAQLDSSTTTFVDTGVYIASAQVIARAGNTILDNSQLEAGTYKTLCTWKRRLVTSSGSSVYISDLNKPESWPLLNRLDIPSGGEITGVAIISFTPNAASTDEFLCVFKESECWIITGDSASDWTLQFVDYSGSLGQSTIAEANGYLYFIDNRGIYLWDGVGKPVYLSRPLEDLFGDSGSLERAKLYKGSAVFFKRQNEVVWYLSDSVVGEQKYILKLDLRLTLPQVKSTMGERILDGTFLQGKVADPVYASASFNFPTSSSQEDLLLTGDDAGYIYRQFYSTTGEGPNDYDFSYVTKYFDMGAPNQQKQFYQVVAWVSNLGNWPLTLDFWSDWKTEDYEKNTVQEIINSNTSGKIALWDVARWDEAKWDSYSAKPRRIVFNLNAAPFNNNQGEVIKLRFRNEGSDEPVTIYGFGISYALLGTRT